MSFFGFQTAAQRYARSRPYFHPQVMAMIRQQLGLTGRLPQALDVACGTGQSTVALAEIAQRVVGVDASGAMLAQAPVKRGIGYLQAAAEAVPLASGAFDLLTVALAFHWLQREKFLTEARRLLRAGGWLVIYNNGFTGEMAENPSFRAWSHGGYQARYPTPPRNRAPFTDEQAGQFGFVFVARETFRNRVVFSPTALAGYLMTQSNVIAAVEQGQETTGDVYDWLVQAVTPFFDGQTATFLFGNSVWFLQAKRDGI